MLATLALFNSSQRNFPIHLPRVIMPPTDVAHAFRALRGAAARREALTALLRELDPYEWRDLHAELGARAFKFDIVGTLPQELVHHIFSYLETTTPYRLQQVSKRWHGILQSTDIVKPALRAWYDGTINFKGADDAFCLQQARRMHRVRTGNLTWRGKCESGSYVWKTISDDILIDDTFIWLDRLRRVLTVLDLPTMKSWEAYGDAREHILDVALSTELVAYGTTSNTCYVSDLKGGERKRFKVTNPAMFNKLHCRGRTVACAGYTKGSSSVLVYIWDIDTQCGQSFTVSIHEQPFKRLDTTCDHHCYPTILLCPESQTILFFSTEVCSGCRNRDRTVNSPISWSRFTYSGQRISDFSWRLPDTSVINLSSLTPVDRQGRFALDVYCRAGRDSLYPCLQFDENLDEIVLLTGSLWNGPHAWVQRNTRWWKDTFYSLQPGAGGRPEEYASTPVAVAHLGTSASPRFKASLIQPESEGFDCFRYQDLKLNDKFLILLNYPMADAPFEVFVFEDVPEATEHEKEAIALEIEERVQQRYFSIVSLYGMAYASACQPDTTLNSTPI
ncbi:hypothetical protein BDV95DRAFT_30635 [Massariosphaeria phaeospora]|uniref:F-box domain-containing protein n=1 Tax=Massariosphaeria phaeospora TaxID=100035 RepID=A0A7C8IA15_9PLEO|nr:hypothetical protein BDV95DRAFT_30635 [Massariosphaeria phaeospora]